MNKPSAMILACLFTASALSLSGCVSNPAAKAASSGEAIDVSVMKSDIELGRKEHEKTMKELNAYSLDGIDEYVNQVGQRLVKHSDVPDLKFTFTVIDSPDINAFALPGGFVYINRGLIGYLNSEAEMAAVLSHEIAHVAARHSARQRAELAKGNILSGLASIVSYDLASATAAWNAAWVSGYGRDMELEADAYGARYLAAAGYDPEAMIDVISVLKYHERLSKQKARDQGKNPISYHGVFASHPRNDKRLLELVRNSESKDHAQADRNVHEFRSHVDRLIWGESQQIDDSRYYHTRLNFSIRFPENWQVKNESSALVASSPDEAAITINVNTLRTRTPPDRLLKSYFKDEEISKSQAFQQYGLLGEIAYATNTQTQQQHRVAVIFHAGRAFFFSNEVTNPKEGVDYDKVFVETLSSFRPMSRAERSTSDQPQRIHYVQATDKTTFAELAKRSKMGPYAEEELRIMNNYYPRGEPKPGEWIKVVY